ncbi:MAG: HNH endonuclease signature motif containing protein, partial [Acidobacteria bacterium]|nr:HNH endonuclease signature motif containing protein [Acidobacteriota bacterium]
GSSRRRGFLVVKDMGRRRFATKPSLGRKRWARARAAALARDGYRCRACGRFGGRALEVDHITPISEGGAPFDLANLQSLCRDCHIDKTRRERGGEPDPDRAAWRARILSI